MSDLPLRGAERAKLLGELVGWAEVPGRDAIAKTYRFKSFSQAWGWMSRVALYAEKTDHHPEWTNIYGQIDVILSTHSAAGLTQKDIAMAKKMDIFAGSC